MIVDNRDFEKERQTSGRLVFAISRPLGPDLSPVRNNVGSADWHCEEGGAMLVQPTVANPDPKAKSSGTVHYCIV